MSKKQPFAPSTGIQEVTVRYRGKLILARAEPYVDVNLVKREIKNRIDHELDVEPLKKINTATIKELTTKRIAARQKALDNLYFAANPELIALLEEYHLVDFVIENTSLQDNIIEMVVPQLKALKKDIAKLRSQLDKSILEEYWNADNRLVDFIESQRFHDKGGVK